MAEISDYLNDLGEQEAQEEKKIEVAESEGVKTLLEFYEKNHITADLAKLSWVREAYSSFLEKIQDLEYTSKDVTSFSLKLKAYENEQLFSQKAGLVLSALINNSTEENFEVFIEHFSENISFLGYNNEKKLTVVGCGGHGLGILMQKGSIHVKGDAGGSIGNDMIDGNIIVEGNAHSSIGSSMKGGRIEVKGCVHQDGLDSVGFKMDGGVIVLSKLIGGAIGPSMNNGSILIENAKAHSAGELLVGGSIKINNGSIDRVGEESKGGKIEINGEIKNIFEDCNAEIYYNGKKLSTNLFNRLYYNHLRKNDRIRKLFE